jgi:hypothetical protein
MNLVFIMENGVDIWALDTERKELHLRLHFQHRIEISQ